tara:strand:+ start:106 stop:501 length:396 start_codon:yes stop_codon:yes gene_type:complete
MRTLTDHTVPGDSANHQLTIEVLDEPGQGGACHYYGIYGMYSKTNESNPDKDETAVKLCFQNGPIKEFGVNGVTHEALMAIVIDRLRSFQAGPFANEFNAVALTDCEHALFMLQTRTRERIARGVEGTHQK